MKEGDSVDKYLAGTMLILMLATGGVGVTKTEEINKPPPPKERMKPPREAYTACKGKTEGTVVEFTTPRGETIKGVCRSLEGVLVATPERKEPPPGGKKTDETEIKKKTDE
jgi:hypothetical protein